MGQVRELARFLFVEEAENAKFEPMTDPESDLRLPENIRVEFIDVDTPNFEQKLLSLIPEKLIGIDSEWRPSALIEGNRSRHARRKQKKRQKDQNIEIPADFPPSILQIASPT